MYLYLQSLSFNAFNSKMVGLVDRLLTAQHVHYSALGLV